MLSNYSRFVIYTDLSEVSIADEGICTHYTKHFKKEISDITGLQLKMYKLTA